MTMIETIHIPGFLPRSSTRRRLMAIGLILFLSAGCGESTVNLADVKTYPVKGKVLLPDNTPLTQGTITFYPKSETGRIANAKLQGDGTYSLITTATQEGAAEGEYRVSVMSDLSAPSAKPGFGEPVVDPRFGDEDSSGLTATVKPESNDVPAFLLDPSKLPVLSAPGQPVNNRDAARDRG